MLIDIDASRLWSIPWAMNRLLALILLAAVTTGFADPEYPTKGPDIYDSRADANVLIKAAITKAGAEHKRVLLDFGANWCPWCHLLHTLLVTDPTVSETISKDYVVVMVDVNTRKGIKRNADVNLKYGNPIHYGLPVLMVLDSDGTALTTKDSGELEEGDHHSPAKVEAFLDKWSASKP
jgi:thiol:disulfide interchange protein